MKYTERVREREDVTHTHVIIYYDAHIGSSALLTYLGLGLPSVVADSFFPAPFTDEHTLYEY